jgi:hypothetical protein
MTRTLAFAAGALLAVLSAGAAQAGILNYEATLKGSAESPPTASAGKGDFTALLDPDRRVLDYTVTYTGLSGQVVGAHLGAASGQAADASVPVTLPAKGRTIHGVVQLTDSQINALNDGHWYFDISTSANPGGEIRGQLRRTNGN